MNCLCGRVRSRSHLTRPTMKPSRFPCQEGDGLALCRLIVPMTNRKLLAAAPWRDLLTPGLMEEPLGLPSRCSSLRHPRLTLRVNGGKPMVVQSWRGDLRRLPNLLGSPPVRTMNPLLRSIGQAYIHQVGIKLKGISGAELRPIQSLGRHLSLLRLTMGGVPVPET